MIKLRITMHLRRLVRVQGWDSEGELVGAVAPVAGVGGYGDVEGCEGIGVGEGDCGDGAAVEFGDVCVD